MIGPAVRRVLAALAAAVVLSGVTADAQVRPLPRPDRGPTPRAGSWEVGGGILFTGGFDMGTRPAALTPNIGTPAPFHLFTTETRFESANSAQARLAYYLSRSVAVEGGIRFARPVLSIRVAGDAEGAPSVTAEGTLNHYLFNGSLVVHVPRARFGRGRAVPFLVGGAGYLRELSSGNDLVETGTEYHAGGGVKLWFGNARRRFGVRGEVGLSIREGGFGLEERRTAPLAGASLVYLF